MGGIPNRKDEGLSYRLGVEKVVVSCRVFLHKISTAREFPIPFRVSS